MIRLLVLIAVFAAAASAVVLISAGDNSDIVSVSDDGDQYMEYLGV